MKVYTFSFLKSAFHEKSTEKIQKFFNSNVKQHNKKVYRILNYISEYINEEYISIVEFIWNKVSTQYQISIKFLFDHIWTGFEAQQSSIINHFINSHSHRSNDFDHIQIISMWTKNQELCLPILNNQKDVRFNTILCSGFSTVETITSAWNNFMFNFTNPIDHLKFWYHWLVNQHNPQLIHPIIETIIAPLVLNKYVIVHLLTGYQKLIEKFIVSTRELTQDFYVIDSTLMYILLMQMITLKHPQYVLEHFKSFRPYLYIMPADHLVLLYSGYSYLFSKWLNSKPDTERFTNKFKMSTESFDITYNHFGRKLCFLLLDEMPYFVKYHFYYLIFNVKINSYFQGVIQSSKSLVVQKKKLSIVIHKMVINDMKKQWSKLKSLLSNCLTHNVIKQYIFPCWINSFENFLIQPYDTLENSFDKNIIIHHLNKKWSDILNKIPSCALPYLQHTKDYCVNHQYELYYLFKNCQMTYQTVSRSYYFQCFIEP
jgi:hypothetical protein